MHLAKIVKSYVLLNIYQTLFERLYISEIVIHLYLQESYEMGAFIIPIL